MKAIHTPDIQLNPYRSDTYRADIDGLRSIAVASVVAYHAGLPWISGGYAGVDVFFVISGYLITSLLLKAQIDNNWSLQRFYIRRARRLFPALFAVLFVSTALSLWLLMPTEMEDFGESLATAAAFSSNLMFWSESGYFEGPSEFKPLLHTWSLAVEEQYYLLFPLLLVACRKFGSYLLIFCAVLLASLALSQWYVSRAPAAAFFLLPHRLWELMVGSVLATIVITKPSWLSELNDGMREALSACGLLAIGVSVFGYSRSTAFPGAAALLPTLGTAAIILAGTHGTSALNRSLALRPFVALGLISYSLYLWHWPALVFARLYFIEPLTTPQTLGVVAASVALGWLSWRYIERPFRTHNLSAARVLPISGACIAALVAFGVAIDTTEGAPERLPPDIAAIARIAEDKPAERKYCTGVPAEEISLERLCKIGDKPALPDFIVWGDSHAMTMIPQFHRIANSTGRAGINATINGCAAMLEAWRPADDIDQECTRFNAAVLALIQTTPSLRTVILAGRWGIYAEGSRYKYESGHNLALVDRQTPQPFNNKLENNAEVWQRAMRRTVTALRALSLDVVIIDSVPEVGWNTPNVIARAELLNRTVDIAPTRAEFDVRQKNVAGFFAALAAEAPGKTLVLQPATRLCDEYRCRVAKGRQPLYVDEDHLSSIGTSALYDLLSNALSHSH